MRKAHLLKLVQGLNREGSRLLQENIELKKEIERLSRCCHIRTNLMNHYARMLNESEALSKKHSLKMEEMLLWERE